MCHHPRIIASGPPARFWVAMGGALALLIAVTLLPARPANALDVLAAYDLSGGLSPVQVASGVNAGDVKGGLTSLPTVDPFNESAFDWFLELTTSTWAAGIPSFEANGPGPFEGTLVVGDIAGYVKLGAGPFVADTPRENRGPDSPQHAISSKGLVTEVPLEFSLAADPGASFNAHGVVIFADSLLLNLVSGSLSLALFSSLDNFASPLAVATLDQLTGNPVTLSAVLATSATQLITFRLVPTGGFLAIDEISIFGTVSSGNTVAVPEPLSAQIITSIAALMLWRRRHRYQKAGRGSV